MEVKNLVILLILLLILFSFPQCRKEKSDILYDRSYVDEISMLNETLTIKKKWADPLFFEFVDFGPAEETLNRINESFDAFGFAEIIYLSKYVGDYNITKYGNKLTFENNNNVLVLKRIVL